jgi:hypothetical protein
MNSHVIPHAETCPDCGSAEVITDDVRAIEGHTEIAFVCLDCDTTWPLTCLTEQAAAEGGDR